MSPNHGIPFQVTKSPDDIFLNTPQENTPSGCECSTRYHLEMLPHFRETQHTYYEKKKKKKKKKNQCIVQKLLMGKVELQVHTQRTNGTSKKILLLLVHLPLPLHVLVEQLPAAGLIV
jgi:hypothetical protein